MNNRHFRIAVRLLATLALTALFIPFSPSALFAKACDATTCPDGCCFGLICRPGRADDACGTGGAACVNCKKDDLTCGPGQECTSCTAFMEQLADDCYTGVLSTQFTMQDYEFYSAYSAEDITVPEGDGWIIDRFDFGGCGTQGGNPRHATGFHVLIYGDVDGHPAGFPGGEDEPLWSGYWASDDPLAFFDRDYHNGITLFTGEEPLRLYAGHYWVMIYLEWTTWETDVFWYWALTDTPQWDPALYINPGGGWNQGFYWKTVQSVANFSHTDLAMTVSNCGATDDDDDDDNDTSADDDATDDDDNDDATDDDNGDDDSPPTDAGSDDDDDNGCGC